MMMEEVDSPLTAVSIGALPSLSCQTSGIRKGSVVAGKSRVYELSTEPVRYDDIESMNRNYSEQDDDTADIRNRTNAQLRGLKSHECSSDLRVHDDASSIAVQESGFGRFSSVKRYIIGCSLKRPKAFGASLVAIACVLPLLLAVIILGTILNRELHHSKHHNNHPISESSDSASDVLTMNWASFSAKSTVAAAATDNSICSDIAKDIMVMGGNAVDAAIAATLCLGVISPGECW